MKYDTNPKRCMIRSGNPEKQINILGKIEVPWKRFILTITFSELHMLHSKTRQT